MKLGLGTVQFGLNYGINNSSGKPSTAEVFNILNLALDNKIEFLDTSNVYGDAEEIIGNFHQQSSKKFNVVSKFILDDQNLDSKIEQTLMRLHVDSLYGFLFHRFEDFENIKDKALFFNTIKKSSVKKFGVSLYDCRQLKLAIDCPYIKLIQLPWNVFDASSEKQKLLKEAKAKGIEIHVRSLFLQGLFYKNPNHLTGNLKDFEAPLNYLQSKIQNSGLTLESVCLNHAELNPYIDQIIVGVDSVQQLRRNIENYQHKVNLEDLGFLKEISIQNELLLNPANWRP